MAENLTSSTPFTVSVKIYLFKDRSRMVKEMKFRGSVLISEVLDTAKRYNKNFDEGCLLREGRDIDNEETVGSTSSASLQQGGYIWEIAEVNSMRYRASVAQALRINRANAVFFAEPKLGALQEKQSADGYSGSGAKGASASPDLAFRISTLTEEGPATTDQSGSDDQKQTTLQGSDHRPSGCITPDDRSATTRKEV